MPAPRIDINPDTIDETLERLGIEDDEPAIQPQPTRTNGYGQQFDVLAFMQRHGLAVKETKHRDGRTIYVLNECAFDASHKAPDAAIIVEADGRLGYKCLHNSCSGHNWRSLRLRFEPDAYERPPRVDSGLSRGELLLHAAKMAAPPTLPEFSRDDPGQIPDSLLQMPGYVGELTDYQLETAPYPNIVLAFASALANLAFFTGRKVRDSLDCRTNLLILALASPGAGKDHGRKVNARMVQDVGLGHCLADRLASGEGIEDFMAAAPAALCQTDEFDTLLQQIKSAKDARHENLMGMILSLFSSASSVFPRRRKAGADPLPAIIQPHLVVLGTAVPQHFYAALSPRMLTNGLVPRMLVVEGRPRGQGQEPNAVGFPFRVAATAKWWADFNPGDGTPNDFNPDPVLVPANEHGRKLLTDARVMADEQYSQAESAGDVVGMAVWGRVNEHIRKLALLYACSENHTNPVISAPAVQWATEFVLHLTGRLLFMVDNNSAANPFHADCLRFIAKLREAPDRQLPHSVMLKRMHVDSTTFQKIVVTLLEQGDIRPVEVKTGGRPACAYKLLIP